MKFPLKKKIDFLENTELLANEFAQVITKGDIIVLNGNLGSGKTTLIKLICKNYSIDNVNSPSFSIVNEYIGSNKIYHFDFYRLKKIEELYDIGFEDYLNEDSAIIFIEWGNLMSEILPKKYYDVSLQLHDDNSRDIKIIKR